MTQEEIVKWKAEYKRIVYQYSLIRGKVVKQKEDLEAELNHLIF